MYELDYVTERWKLNLDQPSPIEIPNQSRVSLAYMFGELDYRVGVEVGTARGDYAFSLCRANPKAKLYCIDPWEVYAGYADYTDQEELEANRMKALERLNPYKNVQIIRDYSMDAMKLFEDESLDYVYIDANHAAAYVSQDIYYWEQKVRIGGIVSGHDYIDGCDVKTVVDNYTRDIIHPWFLLDTPERAHSWFWVKQ